MEKHYLTLNDLSSYKIAFNVSNYVWDVVEKWDFFKKKTVGDQLVFGSLTESMDWIEKANSRKFFSNDEYKYIFQELTKLPREINNLISFTNDKLSI